jgi:hypothetical protein
MWYVHRWKFDREIRAAMKHTVIHGVLTVEDVQRILGMARTMSRLGISTGQMVDALTRTGDPPDD